MVRLSRNRKYAGFWIRLLAGALDNIILLVVYFILFIIYVVLAGLLYGYDIFRQQTEFISIIFGILLIIGSYILYYLYFALLESSPWQATIGMKACGLKITDIKFKRISFWRALGREVCTNLSGLILYIGYFMIAFTKKKQGLHDIIAGTYVIEE